MANKLRDIFSDDDFSINCKLKLESNEAYNNFLSALELVQTEGQVVPIEGVASISEAIHDQTGSYPLGEYDQITHFVVGPSIESHEIEIQVNGVKKNNSSTLSNYREFYFTNCT